MTWRWGWLTLRIEWREDNWPSWPWIIDHHVAVRLLPWPKRVREVGE
jgi:hypothetical protein